MRIYLDDERPMSEDYDTRVSTAAECIELLKTGKVECISLDHDLGTPDAGTGYDVAKWIEKAAFDGALLRLSWELHTSNPVGRRRMEAALMNADVFWAAHEKSSELLVD